MKDNKLEISKLLEYINHKYDSSIRLMLDIGDVSMDDVYELNKKTHEELKELIHLFYEKIDNHEKSD